MTPMSTDKTRCYLSFWDPPRLREFLPCYKAALRSRTHILLRGPNPRMHPCLWPDEAAWQSKTAPYCYSSQRSLGHVSQQKPPCNCDPKPVLNTESTPSSYPANVGHPAVQYLHSAPEHA